MRQRFGCCVAGLCLPGQMGCQRMLRCHGRFAAIPQMRPGHWQQGCRFGVGYWRCMHKPVTECIPVESKSETRRPSVPAFWQVGKQAVFVAGHLLPIKFRFARPSPMRHQLQFQGSARCSTAWYGQEAIALPEDFLSAGRSRVPWFAALNVSRIRTDSAQSLRLKNQRCERTDGFQCAGSREYDWGTSNCPARVWPP